MTYSPPRIGLISRQRDDVAGVHRNSVGSGRVGFSGLLRVNICETSRHGTTGQELEEWKITVP